MKSLSKIVTLFVVLVAACSEDDQPRFDARLLEKYNWVLVAQGRGGRLIDEVGDPYYFYMSFSGSKGGSFSQTAGPLNLKGYWEAKGDKLILTGTEMKLEKLTKGKLIYTTQENWTLSWKGTLK